MQNIVLLPSELKEHRNLKLARELCDEKVKDSIMLEDNIFKNLIDISNIPQEAFKNVNWTILGYYSLVIILCLVPQLRSFDYRIKKTETQINEEVKHIVGSQFPHLKESSNLKESFEKEKEKATKQLYNSRKPQNMDGFFQLKVLPFRKLVSYIAQKSNIEVKPNLEKLQKIAGKQYGIQYYEKMSYNDLKHSINEKANNNYENWKEDVLKKERISIICKFYEILSKSYKSYNVYEGLEDFDSNSSLMDFINDENTTPVLSETQTDFTKLSHMWKPINEMKPINELEISHVNVGAIFDKEKSVKGSSLKKKKVQKRRVVKSKYLNARKIEKMFKDVEIVNVKHLVPFPEKNKIYKFESSITDENEFKEEKDDYNGFSEFLWNGIQVCQTKYTPSQVKLQIDGSKTKIEYEKRTFSCKGVKKCPSDGCEFVIGYKSKGLCEKHNIECKPMDIKCPVKVMWLKEKNSKKHTQYLFRCDDQDHNHLMFSSHWRGLKKITNDIKKVFKNNPDALPSEVQAGRGLEYIPAIVDPFFQKKEVISNLKKRVIKKHHAELFMPFEFLDNALEIILNNARKTTHYYESCEEIHNKIIKEFERVITFKKTFTNNPYKGLTILNLMTDTQSEVMNLSNYLFMDTSWKASKFLYETDISVFCSSLNEDFTVDRCFHNFDTWEAKYLLLLSVWDKFEEMGSPIKYQQFSLVKDAESQLNIAWIKLHKEKYPYLNLTDLQIEKDTIIDCKIHFHRDCDKKWKKIKKEDRKLFNECRYNLLIIDKDELEEFKKNALSIDGCKHFWNFHLKRIHKLNKNFSENPLLINGKVKDSNLVERNFRFSKAPKSNKKEGRMLKEAIEIDILKCVKYHQKKEKIFSLSRKNQSEIAKDRNRILETRKKANKYIPQTKLPSYPVTKVKIKKFPPIKLKVKSDIGKKIQITGKYQNGDFLECFDRKKSVIIIGSFQSEEACNIHGVDYGSKFLTVKVEKIINKNFNFEKKLKLKNIKNSEVFMCNIPWKKSRVKKVDISAMENMSTEKLVNSENVHNNVSKPKFQLYSNSGVDNQISDEKHVSENGLKRKKFQIYLNKSTDEKFADSEDDVTENNVVKKRKKLQIYLNFCNTDQLKVFVKNASNDATELINSWGSDGINQETIKYLGRELEDKFDNDPKNAGLSTANRFIDRKHAPQVGLLEKELGELLDGDYKLLNYCQSGTHAQIHLQKLCLFIVQEKLKKLPSQIDHYYCLMPTLYYGWKIAGYDCKVTKKVGAPCDDKAQYQQIKFYIPPRKDWTETTLNKEETDCIKKLKDLLNTHGKNIGIFFIEMVTSCGVFFFNLKLLKEIQKMMKKFKILFAVDEIMTGMRCGQLFLSTKMEKILN